MEIVSNILNANWYQAPRPGELLPGHAERAEGHRTAQAQERAEAQIDHHRMLEAS
jgi:hypothetical protein